MLRKDIAEDDLPDFTLILHSFGEMYRQFFVVGLEVPKSGDRNVIFHVTDIADIKRADVRQVMISAEYVAEFLSKNS